MADDDEKHTYPGHYPPGSNWAADEAWRILDHVKPGAIHPEVRAFLHGAMMAIIMERGKKQ